jgi:hypothetical protein
VSEHAAATPSSAHWGAQRSLGDRVRALARLPPRRELAFAALLTVGLTVGVLVLALSYAHAAGHGDADQLHFHLFWLSQLVFLAPALIWLLRPDVGRASALAVVSAVAAFEYVPKYLRDPSFPLFHDELLHSRQVNQILASGRPFQPSPVIGIIEFFPGLHTTTAALAELAGVSAFTVQLLLIGCLHVLALVGVFLLADGLTRSHRVGGLAAFVYALNPSFALFDSMFAYETLALVLFIWTLVALLRAELSANAGERRRWLALAVLLGCTCVITHHLTSYELALTLLLVAGFASLRRFAALGESRDGARALWLVAVAVAAGAVLWFVAVASSTFGYLAPHLTSGIEQFFALIRREQAARVLFEQSTIPSYERLAAFAAPPIALALSVAGAVCIVRGRSTRSVPLLGALVVLAGLYFASLPLISTAGGNEGARRTWACTYVGIAVLAGIAADMLLRRPKPAAAGAALVLAAFLLVGNVGAGMNQYYRFPGPYNARSDIRTVTPELRAAAEWLRSTNGPGRKIVVDRYSSPALAYFGQAFPATPSAAFPTWTLFLSRRPPQPRLVADLRTSGFSSLLVNEQIPLAPPYYHTGGAGSAPGITLKGRAPSSRVVRRRLDRTPWSEKLYAADNIALYRLDLHMLEQRRGRAR